ncbi:MAG: Blp family class II bacteriocin [Dolichospermum sp.]
MANIQIADLAQVENQFDELSDLELEAIIGGKKGKVNQVLGGAASGAKIGSVIGGPLGGGIGAVAGGLLAYWLN